MTGPLPPTFHALGDAAYAALDRAATVRAMAFTLAQADIDLGNESQCLERLLVMKTQGAGSLFSRAEVDAFFTDAIDGAREIRQRMGAQHVSV